MLAKLKQKFETTDSKAECYLGIEIEHNLEVKKIRIIRIYQSAYTRNVLQKFEMDESSSTPSDANVILRNKDKD